MNTATTTETAVADASQTALTLPERAAVALRTAEHEAKLRGLLANSARIVAPTNKAARDECHSAYMVLKNARCSIVNLASDATEDAKKFTKAVATEAARLIGITQAEEDRLQGLRNAWDLAEAEEKAAKVAAERDRVERIVWLINNIRAIPTNNISADSANLSRAIAECESMAITEEEFGEYQKNACDAMKSAIDTLKGMLALADKREQAERIAEAQRVDEAKRVAAEREELARLQAEAAAKAKAEREELDRQRAEQAEAQRKLDERAAQIEADRKAREAESNRIAEQTARNLQAERDAIAEKGRIEREKEAKKLADAAAELQARQDAFNAELAAHEAKLEASARIESAKIEAAAKREADRAEALEMNLQHEADAAELARCQAIAEREHVGISDKLLVDACCPVRATEELADHMTDSELWPTDSEIVAETLAMFMAKWHIDQTQARARMSRFDWATAVAAMVDVAA